MMMPSWISLNTVPYKAGGDIICYQDWPGLTPIFLVQLIHSLISRTERDLAGEHKVSNKVSEAQRNVPGF